MINKSNDRVKENSQYEIHLNNQGETISFRLTENYHELGRSPKTISPERLKLPEDWTVVSRTQACFRKIDDSYYIYDGNGEKASKNKLFINNCLITPQQGYRLHHGDVIKIGQNPQYFITISYIDLSIAHPETILEQSSISLKNPPITLGRSLFNNLELDAPTVSRCHAVIEKGDRDEYIIKDRSTNGVFVNRKKVVGSTILTPGSIIQIGPFTLALQKDKLVLVDGGNSIRLDAYHLIKTVVGKDRQKFRILNDISLVIEPGNLVALVGGSGAGKSTLLRTLIGIESSIEGDVYFNGDNFRKNFNIYRNIIGYVPQSDIVHENLKVKEVLYYAAKLRLPKDINIEQIVHKTLEQIELTKRQNTLVKNLSGGQLKRVSIGVELLANPKLFFLDEPTSGLDPGLDKKMMQLLRKLADEGRTIILVTHATTNINLCDRIAFLGLEGHLCYYGPPQEAIDFFQISDRDFADIYIKLESKEAVLEEAEKFRFSSYQSEYINNRLSHQNPENSLPPQKPNRSFWQQLSILMQRYFKLIQRDPIYLGLSLLTAPIGIALMTIAIENKAFFQPSFGPDDFESASLAQKVVFIFTCAAIWTGLATSLQEIVKESMIYLRERLVNLSLIAYLSSKVITLAGLAIVQSLLISLVIYICFASPDSELIISYPHNIIDVPWLWLLGEMVTTFLTIVSSISLGLMISTIVKNSTQANSSLPILLLPKIIFAGILFNTGNLIISKSFLGLLHLKNIDNFISWLMLSRWSVGAYGILANINLIIPDNLDDLKDQNCNPLDINMPLSDHNMFEPLLSNLFLNWGVLLLYIIIYLTITFWLLKRKDITN
jgi:ABC-type multidrug transport system ATPase subunit/ABC-type transport system involved in multi-copper enzyme maturation permease subunit